MIDPSVDLRRAAFAVLEDCQGGPYAAIALVANELHKRGTIQDITLTSFIAKAVDFIDAFPRIRTSLTVKWIESNTVG